MHLSLFTSMLFVQRRQTISDLSIRTSFQIQCPSTANPSPLSFPTHIRTLPKNATLARNEIPTKTSNAATSAVEPMAAAAEVPVVEPAVEAVEEPVLCEAGGSWEDGAAVLSWEARDFSFALCSPCI